MITVKSTGDWARTKAYLDRLMSRDYLTVLAKYGPIGVRALANATPKESSLTANSWTYEMESRAGFFKISWMNTHINDGAPIAILLQYGHGVHGGGYVEGRDYINPAIQPIFDQMAEEMWKAVTK
jgi:hypothetical protein